MILALKIAFECSLEINIALKEHISIKQRYDCVKTLSFSVDTLLTST